LFRYNKLIRYIKEEKIRGIQRELKKIDIADDGFVTIRGAGAGVSWSCHGVVVGLKKVEKKLKIPETLRGVYLQGSFCFKNTRCMVMRQILF